MTIAEIQPQIKEDHKDFSFPFNIINVIACVPEAASVISLSENSYGDIVYWISEKDLIELIEIKSRNKSDSLNLVSKEEGVRDARTANLLMKTVIDLVRKKVGGTGNKHLSKKKIFDQVSILGSSMFTERSNGSDFDMTLCISKNLSQEESAIIYKSVRQVMFESNFLQQINTQISSLGNIAKIITGLDCFIWSIRKDGVWESLKPICL